MKKKFLVVVVLVLLGPLSSRAAIGLKAGLNFANVTGTSSINPGSRSGYVVGVFFGGPPTGLLSFRTEFLLSRQGYDFGSNTTTGSVDLNYLLMPVLMGLNLGPIAQIQFGAQVAYLLNAKVAGAITGDPTADKLLDLFNRFDYGLAGGIEVTPVSWFLVGARLNLSFGNLYKDLSGTASPSFFPSVKAKNNVVQLYAGFQF